MSAITFTGNTSILLGDGVTSEIRNDYVDPNHSNRVGPVVAVILADGTVLGPGQALSAASVPVVIAADQSILTVTTTGAVTLGSGSATVGNVTRNDPAATTGNITAADVGTTSTATTSGQSFLTGTATAASAVSATLSGHSSVAVQITGTWVATLEVDTSADGGTTWVQRGVYVAGQSASLTAITTNGLFEANGSEVTNARVRCTAFTSGTVVVRILPGYGVGHPRLTAVTGSSPAGQADVGSPVKIGLVYRSSQPTLSPDQRGDVLGDVHSNVMVNLATKLDATNDFVSAQPTAATLGGATSYHLPVSAGSTNATPVKNAAGTLYGIEVFNTAAYTVFLKIFDKASAPTVGTDTPLRTIAVPPTVGGALGGVVRSYPVGIALANGLSFAITKLVADNDTTAVLAADVTALNIDYK